MDKLKAALTAKIGPLPTYAWALLLIGGYLAYTFITKTGFFAAKAAPADQGTGVAGGYGDPLPGGGPIGGSGSTATTGNNTLNPTPDPYTGASDSTYASPIVNMSASAPVMSGSTNVPAPLPQSGGTDVGFTQGGYSSPVIQTTRQSTGAPGGGGGNFTP